jgi:hypothetical protein
VKPVALALSGLVLGVTAVLPLARRPATLPQLSVQIAPVAAPPPPTSPGAPRFAPPARTVTVTGPVVATRYGPVQVRVVMTGHRLMSAVAVQLPDGDGESRSINRAAGPALARQAVASQGAVDGVSGATWTSNGYRRSLQAALDAARAAATVPAATG